MQKISGNIGHVAGAISSIMLRKNILSAFREGKSLPISLEEILKNINIKSASIKVGTIKETLEYMCEEENGFTSKWGLGESGNDSYCLNIDPIVSMIKVKTLEKMIEQQFSPAHIRVYRLLSKCGALDSKNV